MIPPLNLFVLILTFSFTQIYGEKIIVYSTNDSGPGSFREALLTVKNHDRIIFDNSLSNGTIRLEAPLPPIKNSVQLIGPADPIKINGQNLFTGLKIKAGKCELKNIHFEQSSDNLQKDKKEKESLKISPPSHVILNLSKGARHQDSPIALADGAILVCSIDEKESFKDLSLSGEGTLIKKGEGTLELNSSHSCAQFTGDILVNEGIVETNIEGSFAVSIGQKGLMKGGGTLGKIDNRGQWNLARHKMKIKENYIQKKEGILQLVVSSGGSCGFLKIEKKALLDGILEIDFIAGRYEMGQSFHLIHANEGLYGALELKSKIGNKMVLNQLKEDIYLEVITPFSIDREP